MQRTKHQPINSRYLLQKICALSLAASVSFGSVSCGNAWITAPEREETMAAQMSKAEYAYDKSRFDEASTLFQKVLDKDPSYDDARIKLAYAINADAGLSILDFVTNFITSDSESSETSGKDKTNTGVKNQQSNPLDILTKTVGLTTEEVTTIASSNPTSIDEVRTCRRL